MPTVFAAQGCAVLLYGLSHMGVAGFTHNRSARVLAHNLGQSLAALNIKHNICARIASQNIAGKYHHQAIWPDDFTAASNHHQTIAITVQSKAQISIDLFNLGDQFLKIVFIGGIGLVVWKCAIDLTVQGKGQTAKAVE